MSKQVGRPSTSPRLAIRGQLEIIPRVLSLGHEAEILSPASCRRTIARMIRSMAGQYADVPGD